MSDSSVLSWLAKIFKKTLSDDELRASPVVTQPAAIYLFSQVEAALANGAEIDTGWMDMEGLDKYQLEVDAEAILNLLISSATGPGGSGVSTSISSTPPLASYSGSFPPRRRYVRYQLQNLTGSSVSNCALGIKAAYGSSDKQTVIPLAFSPTSVSQAALVVSVTKGEKPDGTYANLPADGPLYTNEVALGSAASLVAGPFLTAGHKSIELYIATDQQSSTNGIIIEYTNNPGDPSPTYYPGQTFTYGADAVVSGFIGKRFAPLLSGFRLTYTNGGAGQGSLFLSMGLKNGQTEPTFVSVSNDINSSQGAILSRSVLSAKNDLGFYDNLTRADLNGLRVSLNEHEVETPLKPLNNLSGNATSVGTTATQVAGSPPATTKTVEIQSDPTNTQNVYLGFNSGVTSGNAPVALSAGDARVYSVNGTPEFWAVSASGTQAIRWTYAADV